MAVNVEDKRHTIAVDEDQNVRVIREGIAGPPSLAVGSVITTQGGIPIGGVGGTPTELAVGATDDLPSIVNGTVVWQSRERINLRSYVSLAGVNQATELQALITGLSSGRVLVLDHNANLGLGAQLIWTGKRVDLVGMGDAKITETVELTVPIIKATTAHKSEIGGFTVVGAESVFIGSDTTRHAIEVESSDYVKLGGITISGKSRGVLIDRCNWATITDVLMLGLIASAVAGNNYHSCLVTQACRRLTAARIAARDTGSVVQQGDIGGTSWGNSYHQVHGLNNYDNVVYLTGGVDCAVIDAYGEMEAGKLATVGTSVVKVKGIGHRIVGGGAFGTYGGVFVAPVPGYALDGFGAQGHGVVVIGFVARQTQGYGYHYGPDGTALMRDGGFFGCEAHDCVQDGSAFGSIHITGGIGPRLSDVLVTGHLGSGPAIQIAGTSGVHIKRPLLSDCVVIWPDATPPARQSVNFNWVDNGKIDGLTLVNTNAIGVNISNSDNARVRNLHPVNVGALATINLAATATNCVIEDGPGMTVAVAGAGNVVEAVAAAVSADNGDAAKTLTAGTDAETQRWNTPLTAARAVTLSITGAYAGARFRVVREAGATGASQLNVGTGPLKSLAVGQWADVAYDGAAWRLMAFGAL